MKYVFRINGELASVSVTATELLSVTKTLLTTIGNEEFKGLLRGIVSEINKSFEVVVNSFAPFYLMDTEESFVKEFDGAYENYRNNFLLEVSKPRKYCDNVYDAYVQLQHSKEAKSSFPTLKRTFSRLDDLYDKWISNDCFLGLNIDAVLKQKNLLFAEIAERKKKDVEDAWQIFASALEDFDAFLKLIEEKNATMKTITES